MGYTARGFHSGNRALEWLEEQGDHHGILGLVDLRLPGDPGGLQLGHQLSAVYRLPYFYLAQKAEDLQDPKVVLSQPAGYFTFPLDDAELHASIALTLESQKERQPGGEALLAPASTDEAILVTDLHGRITYMNTLAEDLTGWSLNEARQRPYHQIFELLDVNGAPAHHQPFNEDRVASKSYPAILKRRTGERVTILERTTSLMDGNGSLAGLHLVFHRGLPLGVSAIFLTLANVQGSVALGGPTPLPTNGEWTQFQWFPPEPSGYNGSLGALEDPYEFTLYDYAYLDVTDYDLAGDIFQVYNNGALLGPTSMVPIGDDTSPNTPNPDVAFGDDTWSSGTFWLGPGDHSIHVDVIQQNGTVLNGGGFLRVRAVPEPTAALWMLLAGLPVMLRRKRSA